MATKSKIKIRLSNPKNTMAILQVHYDAVHNIASKDYVEIYWMTSHHLLQIKE